MLLLKAASPEIQRRGLVHLVDGVDDQDVHDVVRVEEQVEDAGEPPLGDVRHADESPRHPGLV